VPELTVQEVGLESLSDDVLEMIFALLNNSELQGCRLVSPICISAVGCPTEDPVAE
jgi:hypothetical protein